MYEVDWSRPEGIGYDDSTGNRSVAQDFWKALVSAWFVLVLTASRRESDPVSGTVLADIAKSRADIEGARLLVLSAALQIDKHQAKGALKEIGIAKVCRLPKKTIPCDPIRVH